MQTWKTLDRRRGETNRPAFMKEEVQMTTCVLNIVAILPKVPLRKGKIPFTFRWCLVLYEKKDAEDLECHVCEAEMLKTAWRSWEGWVKGPSGKPVLDSASGCCLKGPLVRGGGWQDSTVKEQEGAQKRKILMLDGLMWRFSLNEFW